MLNSVFGRALFERRKSIIIWSISIIAFLALMVGIYPSIGASENYKDLQEDIPEALQALTGDFDLSTPAGYLDAELYSLMMPIIIVIIAVGFGASAIAREEENGTIELLLARPISRARILLEKTLALEANIVLIAFITFATLALGTLVVEEFSLSIMNLLGVNIMLTLLGITFGYFALMLTAIGWGRGASTGASIAVFTLMYFANTLASLVSWLEPAKNLSLMKYYDSQSTLLNGIDPINVLIFVILTLIIYGFSHYKFTRRDIGV